MIIVKTILNPIIVVTAICIGSWVIGVEVRDINPIFLPSFSDTIRSLIMNIQTKVLWLDIRSSWYRVLGGFILSFIIAYILTLFAVIHSKFKKGLFLIIEFFRYLPIPVFIPLTILWFGVGDVSKVVIIFLGTFAQMIPMFYDSFHISSSNYTSFRSALKRTIVRYVKHIVIPGSLPGIIDNCRICFGWAWTYLIIAELIGAENGLGYAIIRAQRYIATDKIFAFIIIIGIIGIIMDKLFILIKRRGFTWSYHND